MEMINSNKVDILQILGSHIIKYILEMLDARKRCEIMKVCHAWCTCIRNINENSPLRRGCVEAYEIGKPEKRSYTAISTGRDVVTKKSIQIKQIPKMYLEDFEIIRITNCVDALAKNPHPNIQRFYEVVQDKDAIYIICEASSADTIFNQLVELEKYTEYDARKMARQLIEALMHAEQTGIGVSALKPHNILCNKSFEILLAFSNFGHLSYVEMSCAVGYPHFASPEELTGQEPFDKTSVWFLGTFIFVLLSGRPPFFGDSLVEMFETILSGDYEFPSSCASLSAQAKDFIQHMLVVDQSKRWSLAECLEHPWMKMGKDALICNEIYTHELRRFVNFIKDIE